MQTVNIYTYSGVRGLKKQSAPVAYVISTETSTGEYTREAVETVKDVTENQSELIVLRMALERMNRPCNVKIYTESPYVSSAIEQGWLDNWKRNNWKNAKDREIANLEEWQQLEKVMCIHNIEIFLKKEHPYRSWMKNEVRKARKENGDV